MFRKVFAFTISLLLIFKFSAIAKAAPNSGEPTLGEQKRIERMQQIMERKQDRLEERQRHRCQVVTSIVGSKISKFEENRDSHVTRFDNLVTKLDELVAKWDEKGYDTATLKEHIDVLKGMIADYESLYAGFIDKLVETQEYACGDSDGVFKKVLSESRGQLKATWEKRHEIRKYYAETIRKDIADILQQKGDNQ